MDKLTTLGQACLIGGMFMSLWAVVAALFSQSNRSARMFKSASRALVAAAACTWGAGTIVWIALLTDRFDIKLVAQYSRSTQPLVYKITALWGGMAGSLLWWAMVLAVFMVAALYAFRRTMPGLLPVGTAVMAGVNLFFMFMLNVVANPLEMMDVMVMDGNGLNPLLQNYWMSIHPPMLYVGYIGFTVPFAFAVSALWNKRTDAVWITLTRRWTLFAFFTLGVGVLMGGYWAYLELGWGGYWAWDPVENASLIPWLVSAALIHSVFIQERRGMFKLWNFSLLFMTFILTLYGTFLTRSGVLQSVHAFASADPSLPWILQIGNMFLLFIIVISILLLVLIAMRWSCLKAEGQMESLLSRESAYFYGNVVILTLAGVVIYGVTWPWIYQLFTDQESSFTQPFYNAKAVPLGLMMIILMGIAPALGWKSTNPKTFWRTMRLPIGLAGFTAALLPILYLLRGEALGWHARFAQPMAEGQAFSGKWVVAYSFLAFVFVVFMSTVVIQEFFQVSRRKAKAKNTSAITEAVELPFLNPRRFGGLMAHISVGLIFIGVVGSAGFQQEKMETVKRGESMELGRYRLEFFAFNTDDLNSNFDNKNQIAVRATMMIYKKDEDKRLGMLVPSKVFYPSSPRDEEGRQIPSSEVAIRASLQDDLYVVLAGYDINAGTATFLVYVNPLVNFIWAGGILFALTAIPFLLPEPKRKAALARNIEEVA